MKKTYINPEMDIIKLKIQQHLLDTSNVDAKSEDYDPDEITLGSQFSNGDW